MSDDLSDIGGCSSSEELKHVRFEDLFNLNDIQRVQDDFSAATGVASIITNVDGSPITRPSNFCRLCIDVIRKTAIGYVNCCKSDAVLGKLCPDGPRVQPCLSGGLWDAGAGIAVGGRHVANWLIGQVRDETQTEEKMREYAREIGADEESLIAAFNEVPAMSREKFDKIATALYSFAAQLSTLAYQNFQQKQYINERQRLETELKRYANSLEAMVEQRTQELFASNQELTAVNEELTALNEQMYAMNEALQDSNRSLEIEIKTRQQKENEILIREKQYRATTGLLTIPGEDFDALLKSILHDAIQLIGAPGGSVGLQGESGSNFVIIHAVGINKEEAGQERPSSQGLLGEVFASGDIVCVDDYRKYPQRLPNSRYDNATTVMMVPLKMDGVVKGALAANWVDEVHLSTAEEIDILRQFGLLASIALEKANAARQIAYQNQLLKKLAETTAALVNELDVEKVLQNILDQATTFMGIPHGFIQLFEPDGRQARFRCGVGRYKAQVGQLWTFDNKGILAEILKSGKLIVVNDYRNWPQRMASAFVDDITAAMQAPLSVDGKTIGSIGLSVFGEPVTILREKLTIFEQFATVAAIAIKNALDHQKTNYLAFHDTLTGLPNRAHLNRRLEDEMRKAMSGEAYGAVLFIDLDDLKTVNDHFGHTYGDDVIIAASSDIVSAAGETAFVSRVGGDEFIVILPDIEELKRVAQIVDLMVRTLHREYEIKGQRIHMSSSIGVTLYPTDGDDAEEILKNADIAMYAAKSAGKNCWRFYEQGMQKGNYEKLILTNSLRHALNAGELFLNFQPLVALPGRKVTGFEALIRWRSREHGIIPPARFIPLAENKGLIVPIGNWVIEQACRFAKKLADIGLEELKVAVNVSPRQLAALEFVEAVRERINAAAIAPEQLEFEITESVLIESLTDSTTKLEQLSSLGVGLSLDDFGTGFSSLTYLRNLPVGKLKIDKSFIDGITEEKVQAGFVRSIVDMAHVLGLNVVAEGVETEAQVLKLEQFGCDCVQGYVFSKPVSWEEAIQYATQKK